MKTIFLLLAVLLLAGCTTANYVVVDQNLNITTDNGSSILGHGDVLYILGSGNISTSITNNTVTISVSP